MGKHSGKIVVPIALMALCVSHGVGQRKAHGTEYLVSWTGQQGKADQTDHKRVEKGSRIECDDVQPRDGSVLGCTLQFEDGGHYDLTVGKSLKTSDSTIIGLTCSILPQSVGKATYCKLSINPADD